ncbi:uncharacterized protein [Palaemon carinicauda]|uniref:uncharacterized protein n=1 Tax=Palaemon carinicauda TaxID=392227 RepID=UPI0035B60D5E
MKSSKYLLLGSVGTMLIMTFNLTHIKHCEKPTEIEPNDSRVCRGGDHSAICRDVFEIQSNRSNYMGLSEIATLAQTAIAHAKKDSSFLRDLYYGILGYDNPSMVIKGISNARSYGGTNFTVKEKWRLSQVSGHLPHMSCRLREYIAEDVRKCTIRKNRKTHILYIGDSRIRQHVEVMIDLLRDLHLKITTYEGEILSVEEFLGEKGMKYWSKYKHNFKVESLKVPGFLVEFKWAAFLDWGDTPKKVNDNFSFWMKRASVAWGNYVHYVRNGSNYDSPVETGGVVKDGRTTTERGGKIIHKAQGIEGPAASHRNSNKLDAEDLPGRGKQHWPTDNQKTRVGAFEILSRLISSPKGNLPDIVLLNTGAWLLQEYHRLAPLEAIDLSSMVVMDTLRPLLSKLADRTTVVWLAPDPFKEHISHILDDTGKYTHEINDILEWQLNAQALLKPSRVLFWDTFLPISYASREDCMYFSSEGVNFTSLPKYKVFQPLLTWNCQERVHVGFEALSVAVQMVLNHACNPYLDNGYCCSEMHS